MSTELIKAAFNAEAKGVAVCQSAQIEYIGDSQVLTITGLIGSKPFTHRTEPFKKGHSVPPDLVQEVLRFKKLETVLDDEVSTINMLSHEPMVVKPMKNRTGFGGLGASLKALDELKAMADDFNREMDSVKSEGATVAADAKQIAEQAKREIAEARNYLAQFGNGGPE
jgi:hypothetical protein